MEQILGHVGRCTLEFECQPERWLKSGEAPLVANASSISVHNPTPYTAKPLIKIVRSGNMTVSVGGVSLMLIADVTGLGTVTIDCDAGTITAGGVDMYGSTTFYTRYYDFPELPPGDVTISATNATQITVTPRWYVL